MYAVRMRQERRRRRSGGKSPGGSGSVARYPAATDVVWRTSGNYSVAEFSLPAVRVAVHGGRDHAAWFDDGGEWYMTETDIVFGSLPSAVQAAFRDSEYAGWRIDDVDMLEREGVETVYVIEAEGRSGGRGDRGRSLLFF